MPEQATQEEDLALLFVEDELVNASEGVAHGGYRVSHGDADLGGDTVPAGEIAPGGVPH
jgi:hypothetical protein